MGDKIVYDVINDFYSIKIHEKETATFIQWIDLFKTLTIFRSLN